MTSIGSQAFKGCSSLANITIPETVTFIGSQAFEGCSELSHICYSGSSDPGENSEDVFNGCSQLESVEVRRSYSDTLFCGKEITKEGRV